MARVVWAAAGPLSALSLLTGAPKVGYADVMEAAAMMNFGDSWRWIVRFGGEISSIFPDPFYFTFFL